MRSLSVTLTLTALLLPGVGQAQTASPSPGPSPTPSPSATPPPTSTAGPAPVPSPSPPAMASPVPSPSSSPGAAAPSASTDAPQPQEARRKASEKKIEAEGDPTAGDTTIRAETQGGTPEHYWFKGFVDLQAGEIRIQADEMDFYQTDKPDGTKARKIVAVGNVVFMRGEERLAGQRLTMDLDTGQGTFEEARGFVEPGVFVEGRKIERRDADTYRVEGGKFTSCAQPNPRWSFTATSATIDVDDKIVARNVLFKVKEVPAFYLPILAYPIQHDQRSTGVLFPHFGYSSARGFNTGTGFFWAMGRSADQTFYVDHYSRFGYGLGYELRYLLPTPSRGTFRSYAFRPQRGGEWDYDLDWNARQTLPGGFEAKVLVRRFSNLLFQQRFQDSLNYASTRTQRASLNVQRAFGTTSVQALVDSNDTFFPRQTRINRHLPTLRVNRVPQRIGRTGIVFGYEARAENLARGDQDRVDSYSRFDLAPELSRPLSSSFLQVNPRVQLRYTRYGASLLDEKATGPSLDRPYMETDVEVRGPTFSRVFNNPGGFYSDRFKHVIGPEITWRYRTAVDDFTRIPKFDEVDQQLGTNEIRYALVQRFLAKRPGPAGKLAAYEFLYWSLAQTYYVQINDGQSEFDPNYSTGVFGPGGVPDHNSPFQSRLRFRPTRGFATTFDLEYDVNFRQVRNLGLSGNFDFGRGSLQASWSRAKRVARRVENRTPLRNTVRGSGRLKLLPGRLTVEGSADYDFINKTLVQSSGRLRYDVQCCGFLVEVIQYDFNQRTERQFRFSIELANVGSIGNFMGQEAADGRQGLGGRGF